MRQLGFLVVLSLSLSCLPGCGGGADSSAAVAEQDELAKYAAEHPDDSTTDLGPDGGGGN